MRCQLRELRDALGGDWDGKIHFLQLLPLGLAAGCCHGVYRDTGIPET